MPEIFPYQLSMLMTARANSAPWSCREVLASLKFNAKVQRGRQGRVGDDESLHGGLRPPFRELFSQSRQRSQRVDTRTCVHAWNLTWAHRAASGQKPELAALAPRE